ncbi:MAG TPA: hypothetical protein VE397_15375 [Stellaceae bacterium]|nr:hypothetical protein [Stellaceae bacterium]
MRIYRCYFLGRESTQGAVEQVECVDDADAAAMAQILLQRHGYDVVELWDTARLVARAERAAASA